MSAAILPHPARVCSVPVLTDFLPRRGSAGVRGLLGVFEHLRRRHGDLVVWRVWRRRLMALVSHPDHVEQVLVQEARRYGKDRYLRRLSDVLGRGLLTSDGAHWLAQRRLLAPAFHRARLAACAALMREEAERMVASWAPGTVRELQGEMTALTLRIVCRALFGLPGEAAIAPVGRAVGAINDAFVDRVGPVGIPDWLPTPTNRRYQRARRELERLIAAFVEERVARGAGDEGDVLGLLLAARDEQGDAMPARQLRDELVTLILAGHETTAQTLAFCCDLLARHPGVQAAVAAEVRAGEPPLDPAAPSLLDGVIHEALRLYPSVATFAREALEPHTLEGRELPAGTTVIISPWLLHRDARFFDAPARFDPARWCDGRTAALPRFAFFPFGGGARRCIGAGFALLEARTVLAAILRRVRLVPVSLRPLAVRSALSLRAVDGVRVGIA